MLIKSEGIVLRTTDYGETNKIVTLLTREHGKIGVMARGAKKSNSRLSAISQPFLYGTFLIQSSTGLGTLQQGEMIESMRTIREDLFLTAYAAYMTELLDKGTEEKKPNPYLFELLLQSLRHLNEGTDADIILFIVEVNMLSVMGMKPELDQCVHCGQKEGQFHFSIRDNGFICQNCFSKDPYKLPLSPAAARLLRLFHYFDLSRLGQVDVKPQTKQEIRQVLDHYYDEYSGLYLKSKKFMNQMESMKRLMGGENKS
ncbi:DNA repair protein RecO [Bacillus pumilus]|uniref:DNA repair protein RecO n=1 Tax=Bacillus pumilus TaxID=1408 RepID=UPI000B42E434|nr:DNA repair protein RecO [Bacillus pumilus]OUZ13131.1 DNA repair protein RecO [Bacillus pumilus]